MLKQLHTRVHAVDSICSSAVYVVLTPAHSDWAIRLSHPIILMWICVGKFGALVQSSVRHAIFKAA